MAEKRENIFEQLRALNRPFWMVNLMEMIERLAYYGVRVVIPIYIAQADEVNGLHFSQTDKGIIFLWWAIVQSLVPMFSGGFADRYGYKKTIAFSIFFKMAGYILMATQREYYSFLFGCLVLAFGTAIFKPGVQGTMVHSLRKDNSSVGWGIFYMVVNVGGFLGPPLAHFLYGFSWPTVFYGCAVIVSLNLFMLLTYKEVSSGSNLGATPLHILKTTFRNVTRPALAFFILIMSGFWLMLMQLFDMLPNFIVDWVDTSDMVARFHIPAFMTVQTGRGTMVTQEWLINADAGLIVVTVVVISWLVSRMKRLTSIFCGISIASIGLALAGFTMSGYVCMLGILVFAVGEMLASPKMNEYLGVIAPPGEKGLYMGYANIPTAIGWGYGSLLGGQIYDKAGDKANLALRYLSKQFGIHDGMNVDSITAKLQSVGVQLSQLSKPLTDYLSKDGGVDRTQAMVFLQEVTGKTASQATSLLWHQYDPYTLWFPFAGIGIASAVGIAIFAYYAKRWEGADV